MPADAPRPAPIPPLGGGGGPARAPNPLAGRLSSRALSISPAELHEPRMERTLVGVFEALMHEVTEGESRPAPVSSSDSTLTGEELLAGSDAFSDPRAAEMRVVRELGRGGMGVVFQARQTSLGRSVAVKTLRPEIARGEAAQRFEVEAAILGRLEHPSIVPVHAFGHDGSGRAFLAMKEVRGVGWSSLLSPTTDEERRRGAHLTLRGHLEILLRVVEAISFAHDKGVVHRDLKPANVLCADFGEVQVVDWGIALDLRFRRPPREGEPREARGTPQYMAPEMLAGDETKIDERTDIFLLGGTLYELLCGAPPYAGVPAADLPATIGRCDVPLPSRRAREKEVPPGLEEIALKALAKDPANRYQTAEAFGAAIEAYLMHEASTRLSTAALVRLVAGERDAFSEAPARTPSRIYAALMEAIADLDRALELWPDNRSAASGRGRARLATAAFALRQGDFATAGSLLDALPEEMPGAGAIPSAQELRREVALQRIGRDRERGRMRLLHVALGAVVVAVVVLGAWFLLGRRRADIAVAKGDLRERALASVEGATWKEPEDQAEIFERAVGIDPSWREGWTSLAGAHVARAGVLAETDAAAAGAEMEKAVASVTTALERAPDYTEARYLRATCLLQLGREVEAREELRKVGDAAPDDEPSLRTQHAALATLALLEGDAARAEAESSFAIEHSRDPEDFTRRAIARFNLGRLELALEDVRRARELAPVRRALEGLEALFVLASGDERRAADLLVASARAHPARPGGLGLLAWLAARRGDAATAKALHEAAVENRSHLARRDLDVLAYALASAPQPRQALGRAYLAMDDAVPQAGPRAATETAAALRARGTRALASGDAAGALVEAERALADDPSDGAAHLLAARALFAQQAVEAAGRELVVVPALDPLLRPEAKRFAAELDAWRLAPRPPSGGGGR